MTRLLSILFTISFHWWVITACSDALTGYHPTAILQPEKPFDVLNASDEAYESVGKIANDTVKGTAFFIGDGLIVTNYHLTESCDLDDCDLLFNDTFKTKLMARRLYPDVALLNVTTLGHQGRPMLLNEVSPRLAGDAITVIQDVSSAAPGPALAKASGNIVRQNMESYWAEIEYRINTQPGSSGSPVLNSEGQVIAVHKGYDSSTNLNLATAISSVKNLLAGDLVQETRDLLERLDESGDSRIKFDLAEILLQSQRASAEVYSAVKGLMHGSKHARNLEFYFQKIRHIDIG